MSKGASNVQTDLMGPSYSYADHLPRPDELGVGTDGSFNQLGSNMNAVGTYVGQMTVSGSMGNQYYVNTGGTCTAPDGSLQARYNYINNMSNGLIPGVVGDIAGLNPMYLMNSLRTGSSPDCKCYQCPVTTGPAFQFLTPNLSPDFDPRNCKVVDPANCPKVKSSTESFTNFSTAVPLLIAGIAVCGILLLRK